MACVTCVWKYERCALKSLQVPWDRFLPWLRWSGYFHRYVSAGAWLRYPFILEGIQSATRCIGPARRVVSALHCAPSLWFLGPRSKSFFGERSSSQKYTSDVRRDALLQHPKVSLGALGPLSPLAAAVIRSLRRNIWCIHMAKQCPLPNTNSRFV